MPNRVTISGFKEFEEKLHTLAADVFAEADEEVLEGARHWEELAKRAAPVDNGRLRGSITSQKVALMHSECVSPISYSPYVEWGTGSRAIVPVDLESYASQWWTHKVHVGRYPHPYFFVQAPLVEKFVFGNVQRLLTTAH